MITPRQRVLIVDDDAATRLALTAVLEPLHVEVVPANSGIEALRILMLENFAVILLDVRMPGMTGFETAMLIRHRRESERTPIIFITAYERDELATAHQYANGAVDFIYAPVAPEELRAKVSVFANLFAKTEELATRAALLQAAADQFRLVADVAPIGIFQTDAEDRYIYTNPRWSEHTGLTAERALGTLWGSMVKPHTAEGVLVTLADTDDDAGTHRIIIKTANGEEKVLVVTSTIMFDEAGNITGRVGTLADVTAEAHAEAVLSEARDKATEASTLKSNFLANMSHEIRTPMNGVIGMTDLLLETELDPIQRDYAQTVRNSGEALLSIINDILDFSKIEAGKVEVEVVDFSIRQIVNEVATLLRGTADAKGLAFRVTVDPGVPAYVCGDPGRLRQVLTNLVGNALKFTDLGHVTVQVCCTEGEGKLELHFEVADTGVGIAAEKRAAVFEPFMQSDASTSRRYGGTGLGLAISGRLVSLMGGDCGLISTLGSGSVFWFNVVVQPARGRSPLVAPAVGAIPPVARSAGRCRGRLLLAEDNAVNEKVARAMLTSGGFEVDSVPNGAEAVEAMLRGNYDAILMDCQMPELNGYEATATIRASESAGAHIPIIAMTAGALQEDRDRCIASGMDDYISKPVSKDTLLSIVAQWVETPAHELRSAAG